MTETQRSWASARARLTAAVTGAGFPEELAGLLAKELKSPGAMDRMAAWLAQAGVTRWLNSRERWELEDPEEPEA